MHNASFFRPRNIIFLCYIDAVLLATVTGRAQARWMSPRRNFSSKCSQERRVNAMMLIVVVLSVQFGKTLASQAYKFGTSCACPKALVTNFLGSWPIRQVPVSWRLQPGTFGESPEPSTTPPAARSKSAHTCFECSHIFRTFSSH